MTTPIAPTGRVRLKLSRLSNEIQLTLLLFLFSFLTSGIPRVYTQTAAHTLFIEAHGAENLPWAFLSQAVCVPLAGYLYIRAEHRFNLSTLVVGTLVVMVISLTLIRIGISLEVPWVALAGMIYFYLEFALSSLLLWGLANQLMTLRQGKRLFGFLSAGIPVAIIIFGLTTPAVLRLVSPADLFLLSALALGLGILLALNILRHHRPVHPDREAEPDELEDPNPSTGWWKDHYILTMVGLVALSQLAFYFVDNAFYVEASNRFATEDKLAAFLGISSAIIGMVSLTSSVVLTRWLLKWFGVRGGLLTLPVLLVIGSISTLTAGLAKGPAELIFILVVCIKIVDESFRYTVDKTTFMTLFQPLPARQRLRVQAGLESMVEPLIGGIAGLLLVLMMQVMGLGALGITGGILLIACLWTGLVNVQYRGYLDSLRAAVAGRAVSTESLSFDDDESRAILLQRLNSDRPGEVFYSLSLIDSLDLSLPPEEAARLLEHETQEVRFDIARRIQRGSLQVSATVLRNVLATETDADVRFILIEILAATDHNIHPELSAWLDEAEDSIRLGAAVGLIRHGGIEGVLEVGPRLLEDLNASDPDRRRYAARLMGRAGSETFYKPLLTLLNDQDPAVACEALRAAGMVAAPRLWPVMIDLLSQPDLERSAIAALTAVGDPVLPALESVWERDGLDTSLGSALVSVYAGIASKAADNRLMCRLPTTQGLLRQRIMRVLWHRRYRCPPEYTGQVRALLVEEVETATAALHAWVHLQQRQQNEDPCVDLIRCILIDGVKRCVDNCFHLLSLILTRIDVHQAHASYNKGGPVRRSYVVEMLDNTLDQELKTSLFPLLEPDSMETRAAELAPETTMAFIPDSHDHLVQLATDSRLPFLLRAGAAYAAGNRGQQLGPIDTGGDPILQETVEWVRNGCPILQERNRMLTIEKVLVLKSVPVFSHVPQEYLARAGASAREVRLAAGQRLFEEGELGTSLFVIVSGRLEVSTNGKRIAAMGERDVIGEMAALDPEPRSATVTALEDSLLLKLTTEDLDLLMSEDLDVARGIIQTLCRRMRNVLHDASSQ